MIARIREMIDVYELTVEDLFDKRKPSPFRKARVTKKTQSAARPFVRYADEKATPGVDGARDYYGFVRH